MVVVEARLATCTFLLYLLIVALFYLFLDENLKNILVVASAIILLLRLPRPDITKRSALLGCVFGIGIIFNIDESYSKLKYLGWYLCALSFFHFSEYIMTALYNADELSTDSFLLNHSQEYKLAALASWLEFGIELCLFPTLKRQFILSSVGLCLVVFGEVIRKLAMTTAKSNFTHLVQYTKKDQHILVTWGVYSWCRHPGYLGWFYWSIGTQIILCNPVCFFAYAMASWQFFRDRIWDEEVSLIQFFGQDYIDYKNKVGTGLPFIDGFTFTTEKTTK